MGVGLGIFFIHFNYPGTRTNFGVETVRDHMEFKLDLFQEFGRKKRVKEGFEGGGGVKFWMCFKKPSDRGDVDGFNRMLFNEEAMLLEEGDNKGGCV